MRSLHYLLALAVALVQEADECSTAIGPQEGIESTDASLRDARLIQAEDVVIENGDASFLNASQTYEFAPAHAVVKAGLIMAWKGKMIIGKKLGQGAFGTAFIARLASPCPSSENVVIKIQNAQGSVKAWRKEIIDPEVAAMQTLGKLPYPSSGYFVGLLDKGAGPAQNQYSMLLELANKGTLTSVMFDKGRIVTLDEKTIGRMMHQMISGLQVLEKQGIVHRDLKPDNILVVDAGDQLHAKIADFGLACAGQGSPKSWRHCGLGGTPIYMAPETFVRPSVVAPSNDMWAVGVMGYQFLNPGAVVLPFINARGWKPEHLARAPPPTYVTGKSAPLVQLVKALLNPKPKERWGTAQALQHLEAHGFTSAAPPGYQLPDCYNDIAPVVPEPEPEPQPKPQQPKPQLKPQPPKPKPQPPKPQPKPQPAKPQLKVKVQIPKDASAGELVTFLHKGVEYDSPLPADAKKGEEVELDVPEDDGDRTEQVVLHAGADQMQATALIKILEGRDLKGNAMAQYLPSKLRNLDWSIVDIGGYPLDLFMGKGDDAIGNREKLQNGDFGRAIILNVRFNRA